MLVEIGTPRLRRWRRDLLDAGVGPVTVAKAYRLFRSVMNTAVSDRLIPKNPCHIPGAGQERSPERPTATVGQAFAVADVVPERYRLLVLPACFSSLRWGEVAGLARRHIHSEDGTITVERTVVELVSGRLTFGPPKSDASTRVVTVPSALLADVTAHLAEFVADDPDALVFLGPKGGMPRRSNFQEHWEKVIVDAGVPGLHFYDLRHAGNTRAAESGATLRELMDRMGHGTTRAALIYLHKTAGRDRKIADALSKLVEQARGTAGDESDSAESDGDGAEGHPEGTTGPEGHAGGHDSRIEIRKRNGPGRENRS